VSLAAELEKHIEQEIVAMSQSHRLSEDQAGCLKLLLEQLSAATAEPSSERQDLLTQLDLIEDFLDVILADD